MPDTPTVLVLAGPNGAGKSTVAPFLIRDALGIADFVNADDIARGLSVFTPEAVAIAAGRLMLSRIDELTSERRSFAFETTLASRSFAPRLRSMKDIGYVCRVAFLMLPGVDAAIDRVSRRVREGGHDVPEPTIRRRFFRGAANFIELYQPIADEWTVYDASENALSMVAEGMRGSTSIINEQQWQRLQRFAARPGAED